VIAIGDQKERWLTESDRWISESNRWLSESEWWPGATKNYEKCVKEF
jgi:hypothetical protein